LSGVDTGGYSQNVEKNLTITINHPPSTPVEQLTVNCYIGVLTKAIHILLKHGHTGKNYMNDQLDTMEKSGIARYGEKKFLPINFHYTL